VQEADQRGLDRAAVMLLIVCNAYIISRDIGGLSPAPSGSTTTPGTITLCCAHLGRVPVMVVGLLPQPQPSAATPAGWRRQRSSTIFSATCPASLTFIL